ncbi:MAG: NAD(P)H-dependent oxidoreductase [Thermoguttaceae bacterium]|nr:NAD(P)H-dependent oxidoreductase [Thermoguttaceae bacterium]MDO4856831.1 NAD(P)H-dependent oxidoreductase [Thermoguttaceae bacterium]
MKALIVLAHQKPEGSFCGALAQLAKETLTAAGYEVTLKDLYAEHFDPILTADELAEPMETLSGPIRADIQQVLDADFYVVIHPNWWGMPPAILKGWIDRAIRQGFCYAFTAEGVIRKLEGRKGVVFTTGNTPPEIEVSVNGDPLENLWKNIVFKTVGVDDFTRINFASVIMSTPEQRAGWLKQAKELLEEKARS